jgi:hypothetical protein
MKSWFRNTVLIFGLGGIAACVTPPVLPPEIIVPSTTKVLSPTSQAALETVQPNSLTFTGTQPIATGDVVVSAPTAQAPNGFLRKVTGIKTENGKTILETAPATLRQAIQKGSLDVTRALTEADIESTQLAGGVSYTQKLRPQATNPTFSFNKVLFDKDGDTNTTTDQVVLSGLLDLATSVRFDWDIDFFPPDFDFLAEASFTQKSNLTLKGKVDFNFVKKIRIGEVRFRAITFSIGPVPVVIRPVVKLDIGVRGSASGAVDVSVTQTLVIKAGAKYDEEWSNLSAVTNTSTVDSSSISAAINAEAFANVTLELQLYEAVGLFVRPEVFVAFDAQVPRKPFWKLDGGIGVDVGVEIDKWGIEKEYNTRVFEKRFPIASSPNSPPNIGLDFFGTADLNRPVALTAFANDFEDGSDLLITWTSSQTTDGVLGTGRNLNKTFSTIGTRTLTVSTTDSDGATATQSKILNVVNTAPVINISEPNNSTVIFQNSPRTFVTNSEDINEPNNQLACSSLVWTSSQVSDAFPKTGCIIETVFSSLGARTLTVTATDPQGLSHAKTVAISVLAPPVNQPPNQIVISSPDPSINLGAADGIVTLTGSATDPEGGAVTLEWFGAIQQLDDFGTPTTAYGTNIKLTPNALSKVNLFQVFNLNPASTSSTSVNIRITLVAADPQNNKSSFSIVVKYIKPVG